MNSLNTLTNSMATGSQSWFWLIIACSVGLVVAAVLHYLVWHFISRKVCRIELSKGRLRAIVLQAAHLPLLILIWIIFVIFLLNQLAGFFIHDPHLLSEIDLARKVLIILCILWFLYRVVIKVEAYYLQAREKMRDPVTVKAISRITLIVVGLIGLLILLDTFGIALTALLTFSGISVAAIGFAAKDLLSNFISGLALYLKRPFVLGDWISLPERQIEGNVEEIGWLKTTIRNFEQRPIYVPNRLFSEIIMVNASRMKNYRILENISLRLQDNEKIQALTAEIDTMLAAHNELDHSKSHYARLNGITPTSMILMLLAYTLTTQSDKFQHVKQDILVKTLQIITKHGAEYALNPVRVDMQDFPISLDR